MIVYSNKWKIPFQIDEEDYESVSRYSWCIDGYPRTSVRADWGGLRAIRLHEFLMGKPPEGKEWDHINQDKLDNRRENLRAVIPTINQRNRRLLSTNTSGCTGVFSLLDGRWSSTIIAYGVCYQLGRFDSYEEAVEARKAGEEKYWGSER